MGDTPMEDDHLCWPFADIDPFAAQAAQAGVPCKTCQDAMDEYEACDSDQDE